MYSSIFCAFYANVTSDATYFYPLYTLPRTGDIIQIIAYKYCAFLHDENLDDTSVIGKASHHVNDNFSAKIGANIGEDKQFVAALQYSF